MKLAVFGATGRTGKPLVEQALQAGCEVVILVRTPSKRAVQSPRLTVVQGDVMNQVDVDKVVQGSDAVISVIGQTKQSPRNLQTVAINHIIESMNKYGVKRLVSLTGAGVDDPHDRPNSVNHLIKIALKVLSGHVLKDAENHAEAIYKSNLDWVIVRGPMLNEGPYTGKYRVGWVGVNTGSRISRADLAEFLLKQTTDTTYLRQAPMVSD
ncbi:MAG: SDR family oxidoreductase [Ktedonobacteraceae bacterium]|nr:SDR family oxidoreductase [Ktedonobacteraceae bacterium]